MKEETPKSEWSTNFGASVGIKNSIEALRSPYFGRYWLNTIVSFLAMQTQQVSNQWLVTGLTGSRSALGLVSFVAGFSGGVITPLAGVIADRLPKRNLMIMCASLFGLIMAGVTALVWTGAIQVWHVAVAALLLGVVAAVGQPASQTFVYDVVGRQRVQYAMSIQSTGTGVAQIIGPSIAGILIAAVTVKGTFTIATVCMALSVLVLLSIPIRGTPAKRKGSILTDLKDGMRYVVTTRPLFWTMLACATAVFNGSVMVMRPVFARHVLEVGSQGFGFMAGAQGIGTLVGALFNTAVLPPIRRPGIFITLAMLSFGCLVVMYSFAFSFAYILAVEFGLGFAAQMCNVSMLSGLQSAVPEEMRGRVLSTMFMMLSLAPMGALGVGALADVVGDQVALRVFGLCTISVLIGELVFVRHRLLALRAL